MNEDDVGRLSLFVSDAELGQRLGVGEDTLRVAIKQLERNGFPKKDPLFGKKRYWPAVRCFFDKRYALVGGIHVLDGLENFEERPRRRRS